MILSQVASLLLVSLVLATPTKDDQESSSSDRKRQMVFVNPNPGRKVLPSHHQHNSDLDFPLITDNELIPGIPSYDDGYDGFINDDVDDGFINEDEDPGEASVDEVLTLPPPSIECGQMIDGSLVSNGSFSSPGFPDNYPAYLNCVWRITATPGKKILASFKEFDVTASTDCKSDYVIVNTGDPSKGGTSSRYCGKAAPVQIESVDEILEVEFHTNQGDSCTGFILDYAIVTKQVSCGDITDDQQFEFTSPSYPSALSNSTAMCQLTVSHDCETAICQLRLDLVDFRLGPPSSGDCLQDQMIVRANEPLPALCGVNTGQHMYVDVRGRKETNINLLTMPILPKPVGVHNETDDSRIIIEWLHEADPNRGWNIMVTQIPCDCNDSPLPDVQAPTGCLQYHTEATGIIQSLNFDGSIKNYEPCWNGTEPECGGLIYTGHLNNLDYTACIEMQEGYCGISYQQTGPKNFQLSGLEEDTLVSPSSGEEQCSQDYVYIARGHHPSDIAKKWATERYCGQNLGNQVTGPVMSYAKPFSIRFKSDHSEPEGGVALNNRGFQVRYNQIPCSVDKANAIAFT